MVLLLGWLLVAACARPLASAPSDEPPQPVTLTSSITATEFRFAPSQLTVRADVPVRLTFDNRLRPGNSGGALAHDFTIDRLGGHGLLARLAGYRVHIVVAADSEASGAFQLPVGTYEFYCSVDRHREDGMVGTITASAR
ncbi:MAG TPA: hypothetical protein VFE37_13675 [Chloroflexota bacterium]|nr:hypothetical protein [Chloroflexota bacterium]